jgi:hypothetical protein
LNIAAIHIIYLARPTLTQHTYPTHTMDKVPLKKRAQTQHDAIDITPGSLIEVTGRACENDIFLVKSIAGAPLTSGKQVNVLIGGKRLDMWVVSMIRKAKQDRFAIAARRYDGATYKIITASIVRVGQVWNRAVFAANNKRGRSDGVGGDGVGGEDSGSCNVDVGVDVGSNGSCDRGCNVDGGDGNSSVDQHEPPPRRLARTGATVGREFTSGGLLVKIVTAITTELIPVLEQEIRSQLDNPREDALRQLVADPQLREEARQIVAEEMRDVAYIEAARRLGVIVESNPGLLHETAIAIVRKLLE